MPWEKFHKAKEMYATVCAMRDIAKTGDLDELLRTHGDYFGNLSSKLPDLRRGQLITKGKRGESYAVTLQLPAQPNCGTTTAAIKSLLKSKGAGCYGFLDLLARELDKRLINPPTQEDRSRLRQGELPAPPISPELLCMSETLDIKRIAEAPERCCSDTDDRANLGVLANWCRENGVPLCGDDALWEQHQTIKRRIIMAAQQHPCKAAWRKMESGTAVMIFLFTEQQFYSGCKDWMLLFSHCALKTTNESIVESMGCCLDRHADHKRGLSIEHYTKEAFIDWNAPVSQERHSFLVAVLNRIFESQSEWHCVTDGISNYQCSEVVDRLLRECSKLSFFE